MPSIDNIHQDHTKDQIQMIFGGLNAQDPPHLLGTDEVQASTNMDFTIFPGAATVRRGSTQLIQVTSPGTAATNLLVVDYLNSAEGAEADVNGAIYVSQGNTVFRIIGNTVSSIGSSSGVGSANWAHHAYGSFAYFAGGDGTAQLTTFKDDTANTTEWILENPVNPVHEVTNTMGATPILAALTTFTVSQGAQIAVNTYASTGSVANGAGPSWCVDIEAPIVAGNLGSNTTTETLTLTSGTTTETLTNTYGSYAVVQVQIAFSAPVNVNRISLDFGIGGAFNDYYHNELDLVSFAQGSPNAQVLAQAANVIPVTTAGTITTTGAPISPQAYQKLQQQVAVQNRKGSTTRISAAAQTLNTWIIPVTNFETIFINSNPGGLESIGTCRIIVEGTGSFTATLSNFQVVGADNYSLNDINVGYQWWETWAQIDPNSGIVYGESAPTDNRQVLRKVQYCNALLTSANNPSNPDSGITNRIWYRQGGLLGTPYAVGTTGIGTNWILDTLPDISALILNDPMNTDVSTIAGLPRAPVAITDYTDRLFLLASNTLQWSLPGQFAEIPNDSYVIMADNGDPGKALIPWLPRLVIVNDHSVYEFFGNFQTSETDYTLFKTGCAHGCKANLVSIKTPYGIPLLDYDGLYVYTPGQGTETALDWVMQKVGDMWLGSGTNDPAGAKGSRVPAINWDSIKYACAAYANQRLYLGLPTGTSSIQYCNTILVIDFRYGKVFPFQYPWGFNNLFWNQFKNQIYALDTNANIINIETGATDFNGASGTQNTTFSWQTRAWPAPTDILVENFAVQYQGGSQTVSAIYDQTNIATVGTLTSNNKIWTIPALLGTIANDISFAFQGTRNSQQAICFQIDWDAWFQPKKVTYYRTDYNDNGTSGEKIYDVHFTDMAIIPASGTGTVLATAFVDDVAIETFTLTETTSEKHRYEYSYPPETYGNIDFTIYNVVGTSCVFKLYGHHVGARNEPPRVTAFDSDRVSGQEQWWRSMYSDINPLGGTVTATWYLDETATATFSITNALSTGYPGPAVGRDTYPNDIQAQEPYGSCVYVRYSAASPFKHYRTWYLAEPQPARLTFYESSHDTLPSVGVVKTWLSELNPQSGVVTGTVYLDGVNILTQTFTGSVRHIYETGLPNLTTGKTLKAVYVGTVPFKHWRTHFECDPKPFYKNTWNVIYKKWGGATQLDMGRFYELDVESTNTATITSTWLFDGAVFQTDTFTNIGRNYYDRVPFGPGGYAYLMQHQLSAGENFHLWANRLEIERIGVKGFTTVGLSGTPQEQQQVTPAEGQITMKPPMTQYYV